MNATFPPLTEAQQDLAAEAYGRAKRWAAKFTRSYPGLADEFESAATWGAVCAAASFHEGGNWPRWSGIRIKGSCIDVLKSKRLLRMRNAVKHSEALDIEAHRGKRPEAPVEDSDSFEQILKRLPSKQARSVMRSIYVEDHTPTDAGRMLGHSDSYGCVVQKHSLTRLRSVLYDSHKGVTHGTQESQGLPRALGRDEVESLGVGVQVRAAG